MNRSFTFSLGLIKILHCAEKASQGTSEQVNDCCMIVLFSGQSPPCSYELCGSSGTVLCPVPFIHDRATKTTCKVPIQLAKCKSLASVFINAIPLFYQQCVQKVSNVR